MIRSQLKICGGTKDRTRDLVTSRTAHPTDLMGPASELKAATLAEWFKVLTTSHRCSHMDSNPSCSCSTVMIVSFRTDRPGQTVQTQIRLLRVYTVCHSICIVWTHYSMVQPHSSDFRVITKTFLGVRIFRKFTVCCTM